MGALRTLYEYLNDGEKEKREFMAFLSDFQRKRDAITRDLNMIKDAQNCKKN